MSGFSGTEDTELLDLWDQETDFNRRDEILEELQSRGLFPGNFMKQWEDDTGAYPSTEDPEFLQKLLAKREFAESLQTTWKPENDPCGDVNKFEVTPVQRFAANLMSPRSPYMSALLFHGVGVGKTCAAVQIAEAWLRTYPSDKIFLVTPPTIKEGFYRTIFDITKVTIGAGPSDPNTVIGCTGDSYLEMTGTIFEKDPKRIESRVRRAITRRYAAFGYISFGNYVRDLVSGVDREMSQEQQDQEERRIISRKFDGKLLIIDEAHNLRDETGVEETDDETGKTDMAAGKLMTPWLLKVLEYSQGLKLVLLTATPMYNSYLEIIFMLNLLLMNDKKATITETDIFHSNGRIRTKGMDRLGYIASRYVSFMRGENPKSFPIRLDPDTDRVTLLKDIEYPERNPRGGNIPESELVFKDHLPIVPIELEGDALEASLKLTRELDKGDQGISGIQLGTIIQAGNFVPPSPDATSNNSSDGEMSLEEVKKRLNPEALEQLFRKSKGPEITYTSKTEIGAGWLAADKLATCSPKFAFLLDQLRSARGVCFVYMRVVNLGALPLALALEANGYTPVGRATPLLGDGIQAKGGRQCALCPLKEKKHTGTDHPFTPACYGLLTGNAQLSPNNKGIIDMERRKGNEEGGLMKVIVGSQIAAEGVDLRYVREVHMLDSWYHLNRTEQVIGRAIRFCSHSALPEEKRNATIYLYSAVFPDKRNRETGDLFSYRTAFRKAVQVGNVTRALKIRAIDCNLNHDAIIIAGQDPIRQIDSKGTERRNVDINDKRFTAICDWNDSCMYECAPKINVNALTADDSTYSEFAAKWRESALKDQFRKLFADQVFYDFETMWYELFGDVPLVARTELFENVVNNKAFQVTHNGVNGYITYCNGYYVFQPNVYMDLHIPMAIRAADFPVKRDHFDPDRSLDRGESSASGSVREPAMFTLKETWQGIVDWVHEMEKAEEGSTDIPEIVADRISQMTNEEPEVLKMFNNIIETIQWFQESVLITGGSRSRFGKAVLEYIWDNWFSMPEQIQLLNDDAEESAYRMVRDTKVKVDPHTVIRLYNTQDASIQYMCKGKSGWSPCSDSIARLVKKEEKGVPDLFRNHGEGYKTGPMYGVSASHEGKLTLKMNKKIKQGFDGRLGGVACGIVSNISDKHKKLIELGDILREAGLPDLELDSDVIKKDGSRAIENSVRGCTLLELVFRYMDHLEVNKRRWFFRPVVARLIGYAGYFKRKEKTASAAPVKKRSATEGSDEEEEPVLTKKSVAKKTIVESEEEEEEESPEPVKTVAAKSATKKSATKKVSESDDEDSPLFISAAKSVPVSKKASESKAPKSAPTSKKTSESEAPKSTTKPVSAPTSKKTSESEAPKSATKPVSVPVKSATKPVSVPASKKVSESDEDDSPIFISTAKTAANLTPEPGEETSSTKTSTTLRRSKKSEK